MSKVTPDYDEKESLFVKLQRERRKANPFRHLLSLKCLFAAPLIILVCFSCIVVWLVTFLMGYRSNREETSRYMLMIKGTVSEQLSAQLSQNKAAIQNLRKDWYAMGNRFDVERLDADIFRTVYVYNTTSCSIGLNTNMFGQEKYYCYEHVDNSAGINRYYRWQGNDSYSYSWLADYVTGDKLNYVGREKFIVSQRPWFKQGLVADPVEGIWTSVFLSINNKMMTLPYAIPLYNSSLKDPELFHRNRSEIVGVMKGTLSLQYLNAYLGQFDIDGNGLVMITESDKMLLSTSAQLSFDINTARISALNTTDRDLDIIAKAFSHSELRKGFSTKLVRGRKRTYLVLAGLYQYDNLNWYIFIATEQRLMLYGLLRTFYVSISISSSIIVVCLIAAGIGAFIVNRSISKVTRNLKQKMDNLQSANFTSVSSRSHSAISELQALEYHFSKMETAILGFMKYVPSEVVRSFIGTGFEMNPFSPGVIPREIAILFTDIVGFTSICELVDPVKLVGLMTTYFEIVCSAIVRHNGTLDKYIGDATLVLFNCPSDLADYPLEACACALAISQELSILNRNFQSLQLPALETRIGVHIGTCLVGNVGSSYRLSYTALGDAVNTASRIESANRIYGTSVLISGECYEQVKGEYVGRLVDKVCVKGKSNSTSLYELVAQRSKCSKDRLRFVESCNQILEQYYFQQKFHETIETFNHILTRFSLSDKAIDIIVERSRRYLTNPPDREWNGAEQLVCK